jgi:hypothetical protein
LTCPETDAIAKKHEKEVQTVYNSTSHTVPDASESVSKVAEAIILNGLLKGAPLIDLAALVPRPLSTSLWYKDHLSKGWEVIHRGYIQSQIETMPLVFHKPYAGGDVRPVVMKGGTGWPGVGRLDAAARQGLNEALARLNPVDLGPQVGDRIHDDEDGVPE